MCNFISFLHEPKGEVDVRVWHLTSHARTQTHFGLTDIGPNSYHEGHYLQDGTIQCRGVEGDFLTPAQCEGFIRAKWPTFMEFLNQSLTRTDPEGDLCLGGLTGDGSGLQLPKTVKGALFLSGLTGDGSRLRLPKTVRGWLDLSGLTGDGSNLTLPQTLGGNLFLSGLTGDGSRLRLPKTVRGDMFLGGLTGDGSRLRLPKTHGTVYLRDSSIPATQ